MGKLLYIQINASTYDEKKVRKTLPILCEIAWSEKDKYIPASQSFGIIELITTLNEALEFANLAQEVVELLVDDVALLMEEKARLSKAIISREVHEADAITYSIEEKLIELENKAKSKKILKIFNRG